MKVLHAKRSHCRSRRLGGLAAALATGLTLWSAAVAAGQASSAFLVTINVLPENPASCSASSTSGSPQVTCRPNVVGVTSTSPSGGARDPTIVRYRTDGGFRLAGETIEVGNENYYAWSDGERVAWGEYSSRMVLAGGREYVEMTVSW